MLSKLLVVKSLGYLVKIFDGAFLYFLPSVWISIYKSVTGLESSGMKKTDLAQQRMFGIIMHRQIQRVELICRVLICNLLGFEQISVGQNDFESSSRFASSLRLLRDGATVEDNLQGENGEEFSQNGPTNEMR